MNMQKTILCVLMCSSALMVQGCSKSKKPKSKTPTPTVPAEPTTPTSPTTPTVPTNPVVTDAENVVLANEITTIVLKEVVGKSKIHTLIQNIEDTLIAGHSCNKGRYDKTSSEINFKQCDGKNGIVKIIKNGEYQFDNFVLSSDNGESNTITGTLIVTSTDKNVTITSAEMKMTTKESIGGGKFDTVEYQLSDYKMNMIYISDSNYEIELSAKLAVKNNGKDVYNISYITKTPVKIKGVLGYNGYLPLVSSSSVTDVVGGKILINDKNNTKNTINLEFNNNGSFNQIAYIADRVLIDKAENTEDFYIKNSYSKNEYEKMIEKDFMDLAFPRAYWDYTDTRGGQNVRGKIKYPAYYDFSYVSLRLDKMIDPVLQYMDYQLAFGDDFSDVRIQGEVAGIVTGVIGGIPYFDTLPKDRQVACRRVGRYSSGTKANWEYYERDDYWSKFLDVINIKKEYSVPTVPYPVMIEIISPRTKQYTYTGQALDWNLLLRQAQNAQNSDYELCTTGRGTGSNPKRILW